MTDMVQDRECAVQDCRNEGRRQICPFDDRVHHHGRIHYPTDQGAREIWSSVLTFRPLSEGWLLICDEHYKVVVEEVIRRRAERRRENDEV